MGAKNTYSNKKNIITNIKSKIIFKKIFNRVPEIKFLKIIQHNKKFMSLMDKNINDYKKYSNTVIEIFPLPNHFGKFINIENPAYFHIYFNDMNNERITRNIIYYWEEIYKITIVIDYSLKSFEELFKDCELIYEIKFIKCNRKDRIDINKMFYGCKSLKKLDLSKFNATNLTGGINIFNGCDSLKELNFPKLYIKNIIAIGYIFLSYQNLKNHFLFEVIKDKYCLTIILSILLVLLIYFPKILSYFFVLLIISLFSFLLLINFIKIKLK